ncbi:KAP NTPase domain-containing protein [Tumidithrix helvetica PCC 7403]|uniref:P-loop NTPase fold protein n=1 Tax=Tumidithrix helvetica TaxID=3457545 RepID=UPI003C8BB2D0
MIENTKLINSHIEEYLDYYCGLSHAPGFAVLLKGQWGVGKTWFIKQYQEKLKAKKQKCLYVSLYGMTNSSEIGDAFFQQLHPVLSSKGMTITGKILKGFLKGSLKIDLNGDGKDEGSLTIPNIDIPDYLKNADKCILIFDDLERCKIDLSNILGYINSFVEHQELKVIILANEKVVESCSEYSTIKEKLIGKTFSISPDFQGALNDFICEVEDKSLQEFLSNNTELIQDSYTLSEYENLRNLNQAILDYERLFKVLPEKVKSKKELLRDLLYQLMVFSIEIKRGTMLASDICNIIEAWQDQAKGSQAKEISLLQKNFHRFNRYQNLDDLLNPFPNNKWWQKFFDKGIIDVYELEKSLPSSKYFQDENTPDWIKLWRYSNLTDDEFDNLLKKVEEQYTRRDFSCLGEIIHVIGLFLMFSNVGIYSKSKKDILQDAKHYIDDYIDDFISKNLLHTIYQSHFFYSLGITNYSYANLGFQGKELVEFKEFYDYINQAQELAKKGYLPKAGLDLLEIMQCNTSLFYRMLCVSGANRSESEDQIYYEVPILESIKPDDFIEKLLPMKREDQKLVFYTLSDRYKFENSPKELHKELPWLKSVQTLLLKQADSKKGKLSGFFLESLSREYLEEAIKKLNTKISKDP